MSSRKRKIATLVTTASLALFALVYGFAFPSSALAWNDCPKGWVDDPYPGACRRYVDTNNDGICDLSQSEPVAATTTTAPPETTTTTKPPETTTTTALAVTTATSGEPPAGDCPLGPCAGCGACLGVGVASALVETSTTTYSGGGEVIVPAVGGTEAASGDSSSVSSSAVSAVVPTAAAIAVAPQSGFITHYLVSPIALGFFLIYGASFFLYKTRRIRIATHRKIWNVLLLGTFLVTGIFGVILTIQLDYPLPFTMPIDLLFWHVEAGIAMTLISLFHMGWHFNYYKNVVRNARAKMRVMRETERELDVENRRLVLEARATKNTERDARGAERDARRAQRETSRAKGRMELELGDR
jgi:hypothetical protein